MSCFQTLKEKGYRLTPQRKVILEILHQTDEHVTAENIYDRVRARLPRANKSTIYRTLELLKKLNLVAETNLGGNSVYYHHIEQAHHHHLVCQECGAIIDLDESVVSPFKD
ncbi:MAG: transcriptional repressor, partial [Chloroflexi bacterium]|nr:transcriptional repressor [Chloroflexota bacterium]